jgi:hypothetical protein
MKLKTGPVAALILATFFCNAGSARAQSADRCGISGSGIDLLNQISLFIDEYDQQITKLQLFKIVGPEVGVPWSSLRNQWYDGMSTFNNGLASCSNTQSLYSQQLNQAGYVLKILVRAENQSLEDDTTPNVKMLDPIWSRQASTNDPESDLQYYLKTIAAEDHLLLQSTNETIVAVIDDGIYVNHPDLRNNIWINRREVVGNGVDDDGNGYTDDVYGYDFVNHTDEMTVLGDHGTHVGGIIGASSSNGMGLVGIAPQAKLMSLIACSHDGCSSSAISEAVHYAVDNGAKVINLSFGTQGTTAYSIDSDSIIQYAFERGVLVVVAAGNGDIEGGVGQNLDFIPQSPICNKKDMQLGVAAVTPFMAATSWTNSGSCVDIYAPGTGIISTAVPLLNSGASYTFQDGTSFSAPIVAGVVARLFQKYPHATPTEIMDLIKTHSNDGVVSLKNVMNAGFVPAADQVAPPQNSIPTSSSGHIYDRILEMTQASSIDNDKELSSPTPSPCPGKLIKGSTPALYYCGADGKRYVFPNSNTYNTWYADFSGVVTLSDADLAKFMLGGNVTYRPGARLVKIQTDPKVYAIARGGVLRWVTSESVATRLYGANWNRMVDDVPDAFFVNYKIGAQITESDLALNALRRVGNLMRTWLSDSLAMAQEMYQTASLSLQESKNR